MYLGVLLGPVSVEGRRGIQGVKRGRNQAYVGSVIATDTPTGALNNPLELSQVG